MTNQSLAETLFGPRPWYYNITKCAAMILLVNTIAMAWTSLFIESPRIITLMILSGVFCIFVSAIPDRDGKTNKKTDA